MLVAPFMKITVIAAGFGDGGMIRKEERSERMEIKSEPVMMEEKPKPVKKASFSSQVSPIQQAEEDEWDIPAFIRKKMK